MVGALTDSTWLQHWRSPVLQFPALVGVGVAVTVTVEVGVPPQGAGVATAKTTKRKMTERID